MTTIATNGFTVCSDSRRTMGQEIIDNSSIKIVVKQGKVFAFTNDFGVAPFLVEWYLRGADPKEFPKEGKEPDGRLLVMEPERIMSYSNAMPYGEPFPYPQAFGSGATYAMGAMAAGASPWEAIEIASRLDAYTGGPIQQVNLAQAWGVQKEAAE